MSRLPSTFRVTDVIRAIKAARNAGLEVESLSIDKHGTMMIVPRKPVAEAEKNEWDTVS